MGKQPRPQKPERTRGNHDSGLATREDAFSILEHAGINHSFIEDAVPEFVLYWRETGLKTSTWNTKFIAHVRRQWAKFEVALEHDTTPKLLPEDYQPSEEVFEVLEMANIDPQFAQG